MSKKRLDQILIDRGFFDSREKAKIAIMEGLIFVDNQKEDKAGTMIKEDATIEFRGEKMPYVSRGGFKLKKAIDVFNIDLKNKICMDIGSSTGGFTDCMLQQGASYVFSIDCGTNQLAYKLRIDDRVKVLEKTNARYLEKEMFDEKVIDFSSIDVSFISLELIIPKAMEMLKDDGEIVALIKPQFEVGREDVGDGIIRDKKLHIKVIKKIIDFCIKNNYFIKGIDYSPIKGPKGNIEYLIYLRKQTDIGDALHSTVGDALYSTVGDALHNTVGDALHSTVGDALYASLNIEDLVEKSHIELNKV